MLDLSGNIEIFLLIESDNREYIMHITLFQNTSSEPNEQFVAFSDQGLREKRQVALSYKEK